MEVVVLDRANGPKHPQPLVEQHRLRLVIGASILLLAEAFDLGPVAAVVARKDDVGIAAGAEGGIGRGPDGEERSLAGNQGRLALLGALLRRGEYTLLA